MYIGVMLEGGKRKFIMLMGIRSSRNALKVPFVHCVRIVYGAWVEPDVNVWIVECWFLINFLRKFLTLFFFIKQILNL